MCPTEYLSIYLSNLNRFVYLSKIPGCSNAKMQPAKLECQTAQNAPGRTSQGSQKRCLPPSLKQVPPRCLILKCFDNLPARCINHGACHENRALLYRSSDAPFRTKERPRAVQTFPSPLPQMSCQMGKQACFVRGFSSDFQENELSIKQQGHFSATL